MIFQKPNFWSQSIDRQFNHLFVLKLDVYFPFLKEEVLMRSYVLFTTVIFLTTLLAGNAFAAHLECRNIGGSGHEPLGVLQPKLDVGDAVTGGGCQVSGLAAGIAASKPFPDGGAPTGWQCMATSPTAQITPHLTVCKIVAKDD